MTVTTHSPGTNLFLSIPKSDKQHTHPEADLWERMYGVFMMLVDAEGGGDKSSQTNLNYYLPAFFFSKQVHCVLFLSQ